MTRPVSDAASNSHPVAALNGRTNIPLRKIEKGKSFCFQAAAVSAPSFTIARRPLNLASVAADGVHARANRCQISASRAAPRRRAQYLPNGTSR
jgi:hypothetical protein